MLSLFLCWWCIFFPSGVVAESTRLPICSSNPIIPDDHILLKHASFSLNGSEVLFIGDSTIRSHFFQLCGVLGGVVLDMEQIEGQKQKTHFPCSNIKSSITTRVEYIKYGMVNEDWRFSMDDKHIAMLKDRIQQLQHGAFIVMNLGSHYAQQHTSGNVTVEILYQRGMESFFQLLELDFNDTSCTHKDFMANNTHISFHNHTLLHNNNKKKKINYIWRETLPQHFGSSNGFWPRRQDNSRSCPPMTLERLQGHGLLNNECDPTCTPLNWLNIQASKLISAVCNPVIHVMKCFGALLCFDHQHYPWNGDCLHFQPIGDRYLNWIFLQDIARIRKIVIPKHLHEEINAILPSAIF